MGFRKAREMARRGKRHVLYYTFDRMRIRHRGQVFRGYGAARSFRKLETLSGLLIQRYRAPHNHRRERGRSFTSVALALAPLCTRAFPLRAPQTVTRSTDGPSFGETVIAVLGLNASKHVRNSRRR